MRPSSDSGHRSAARRGLDLGEAAPSTLVVTQDDALLDDLLRLAAAAGVAPSVAHSAGAARANWSRAALVVVGCDLADQLCQLAPLRRRDVLLVSGVLDDTTVWRSAVSLGVDRVVILPDDQDWLVGRLADTVEGASRSALTLAVVGGRGGAGATTLACALAVTGVTRGSRAMLVDADPLGGGIDLVIGAEEKLGLRWPDLAGSAGRLNAAALRSALPVVDALEMVSWDRGDLLSVPDVAMRAVLDAAQRACDLVVVDLPRRADAAVEEALSRSTSTLLVVPREVRAVAAAARVLTQMTPFVGDVRCVVRGAAPSGIDGRLVASTLGLPLAGEWGFDARLAAAAERGEPPTRRGRGRLAELCTRILAGYGLADRATT